MQIVNFWCHTCREDHALPSSLSWLNSAVGEVWTGECPSCGRWVYRLRDVMASEDVYFRRSRFVRAQRRLHNDDMVQVGDSRFNLLYPQHEKERIARENEHERKTFEDIQARYG